MKRMLGWAAVIAVCVGTPLRGAAAQDATRLTIHGYLNQAFGIADGGSILGIPEGGTGDYRTAALLFRHALSDKDHLTLQVSHRRLGQDMATTGEQELHLNWAFYGRQVGDLTFKVGRVPIPSGIYNELRNVGVVLPMYRAPFNFYLEGTFTSEVVDGVVAGYKLGGGGAWGVDASAFYGGWTMVQRSTNGGVVTGIPARVEDGFGGQAWILTPLDGLRIGAGASRYTVEGNVLAGVWHEAHASLDASVSRATLRGEYRRIHTPDITYWTYYGYLGVRVTQQLVLHGQLDYADLAAAPLTRFDYNDDHAFGVSYAFRPNLVVKAEGHASRGYWTDDPVRQIGVDAPAKVTYLLFSVAASF